jgi:hypothetical protein
VRGALRAPTAVSLTGADDADFFHTIGVYATKLPVVKRSLALENELFSGIVLNKRVEARFRASKNRIAKITDQAGERASFNAANTAAGVTVRRHSL